MKYLQTLKFLAVAAAFAVAKAIALPFIAVYSALVVGADRYAEKYLVCYASGNPQDYPTMQQFGQHIASVVGKIEIIEQELYDRITYPHAGLQNFAFFSNPIGTGFSSESGNGGNTKTLADTNMTQQGQLPAPQAFWIDNIQVDFDPGSTVATANDYTTLNPTTAVAAAAITGMNGVQDKHLILNAGVLTLTLGQKPYYSNGPLTYFPPRAQKRVDASYGNADTTTHNMVSTGLVYAYGQGRALDPGLGIFTGFNFGVNINFPVLQATVTNNGRIKTMLGGWLFRAAQ